MTALAPGPARLTPDPTDVEARAPRPGVSIHRIASVVIIVGLVAFGVYSYQQMDLRWSVIRTAWTKIAKVFHNFAITFPSTSDTVTLVEITLGIVVLGTLIAAIISVPVAYIAASNTTPLRPLRFLGRAIGVVTRAVPDWS